MAVMPTQSSKGSKPKKVARPGAAAPKTEWKVTPNRTIRMDDETWEAAKLMAAHNGLPLTAVIRYYLREYAGLDQDQD